MLAARVTTTGKHAARPSIIALSMDDPLVGFVLCDDLAQLYRDELTVPLGGLTPATMRLVSNGLRVALAV